MKIKYAIALKTSFNNKTMAECGKIKFIPKDKTITKITTSIFGLIIEIMPNSNPLFLKIKT
jgi:hypothetical protein